jgi:hypothetical protein
MREFNPRYTEAEGALLGQFRRSNERNELVDYARRRANPPYDSRSELHPDVAVNQARKAPVKALVEA